jgi:PAS domain S-box-containing protein
LICYEGAAMTHERKTKARLIEEIHTLRSRLQDMEAYKSRYKQAEEALRQSDTFYNTFLENTGTATIIIEEDTTISMLNVEFEMVTGYARDEMVGHTWTRYVADEDIGRLLSYHRKRRSNPDSAPRNYEFKIKTKQGELRDIYMTIAMIPGTKLSIASMLDITERKQLEKEILNISERERQKIGQELHDDLGQHLIGIEVMTKVLKKTLEDKALEEANYADEINTLVKEAITKTRRLARGLCPVHLVSNGLEAALDDLASSVSAIFGITCTFICPKTVPIRDNTRATHLYYIVKESIHNAIEHGKASWINVEMRNDAGTVSLEIRDNGIGIQNNVNHAGLGIRTMNYRAKMIDAALMIEPAQTGGTVVSCIFDIGRSYPE